MKLTSSSEHTVARWISENQVYLPARPLPCCMTTGQALHSCGTKLLQQKSRHDHVSILHKALGDFLMNRNIEIPVMVFRKSKPARNLQSLSLQPPPVQPDRSGGVGVCSVGEEGSRSPAPLHSHPTAASPRRSPHPSTCRSINCFLHLVENHETDVQTAVPKNW